jgi:hypothetical protein
MSGRPYEVFHKLHSPSKTIFEERQDRLDKEAAQNFTQEADAERARIASEESARVAAQETEEREARRRAALARNRLSTVISPMGESVSDEFLGKSRITGAYK